MSTTIVNTIICVLWLSAIIYLIFRLRDVNKNPKKYDSVKGFDKYVKSMWYWKPDKEFSRLDPPNESRFVGINCLLITVALLIVPKVIFADLYPDNHWLFTFSLSAQIIFMAVAAIMGFLMYFFVPLHLKSPIGICYNLHFVFKGKPRSFAWKRLTAYTLIGTLLCFPLYLLAFNSYLTADDEKLVYSSFFSLGKHEMRYDDITDIEASYAKNGELESYVFVSDNGKTFPLYVGDYSNGELDRIISRTELLD